VVFHTGFLPPVHSEYRRVWLERAKELWRSFLEEAEKASLTLSLENVFEKIPEELLEIDERGYLCFVPGSSFPLGIWGS